MAYLLVVSCSDGLFTIKYEINDLNAMAEARVLRLAYHCKFGFNVMYREMESKGIFIKKDFNLFY